MGSDEILAGDPPPFVRDFAAIWRAADKVVYSTTLETVPGPRTRLERDFDPDAIRRMKDEADRPISVGGPRPARRTALRQRDDPSPLPHDERRLDPPRHPKQILLAIQRVVIGGVLAGDGPRTGR